MRREALVKNGSKETHQFFNKINAKIPSPPSSQLHIFVIFIIFFANKSQKHEKMIVNDSVFLLFLLAVTLPSQPSEAIRGALFRSGRSPAFAPISGGHFVNLGSDEEERLLSLAPHPALMVDLRQLMAFSRATESPQAIIRPIPSENTVAGAIVPTKRAQKLLSPPPAITLGQQWKSPRLTAFLAMARKYGSPPQMQAEEWMN